MEKISFILHSCCPLPLKPTSGWDHDPLCCGPTLCFIAICFLSVAISPPILLSPKHGHRAYPQFLGLTPETTLQVPTSITIWTYRKDWMKLTENRIRDQIWLILEAKSHSPPLDFYMQPPLMESLVTLRVEIKPPNTCPEIKWEGPAYLPPGEVISNLYLLTKV